MMPLEPARGAVAPQPLADRNVFTNDIPAESVVFMLQSLVAIRKLGVLSLQSLGRGSCRASLHLAN